MTNQQAFSLQQNRIFSNPGALLLQSLVIVFGIALLNNINILSGVFILIVSILLLGGHLNQQYFRRMLLFAPFLLLLAVPLLFGAGLPVSAERLALAAELSLKVMACGLVLVHLGISRSHEVLLEGLSALRMPAVMITIMLLSFRYFFMIYEDVTKGFRALRARGILQAGLKQSLPIFGEWIGGFFLKSLDHSEKVYQALKARSFNGHIPRDEKMPLRFFEKFILVMTFLFFLALQFAERGGF